MHGKGSMSILDGFSFSGFFDSGKKHGPGEMVMKDGMKIVGNWFSDALDGVVSFFMPNGQEKKAEYKNGVR